MGTCSFRWLHFWLSRPHDVLRESDRIYWDQEFDPREFPGPVGRA